MKIHHYVINLDRSSDRLSAIEADAAASGFSLIRVPAVYGKDVPKNERDLLDVAGFRRRHGKIPLDGEYGCYQSHINALDAFLASDADAAVIFEDDVKPMVDFMPTLHEIVAVDDWDLVKLMHHRMPMFRPLRPLGRGRRIGSAVFGPTGSSACYLVGRKGAAKLRQGLVPMRLPYDVALERGWAMGLRVRYVDPMLVRGNPQTNKTLIGGHQRYKSRELATWRRLPTLVFRTGDLVRRATDAVLAPKGAGTLVVAPGADAQGRYDDPGLRDGRWRSSTARPLDDPKTGHDAPASSAAE